MATKQLTPKFSGVDIVLNGETYVLPPLPIKAYSKGNATEKIQRILKDVNSGNGSIMPLTQESVVDLVELITLALQRNYPAIDENLVEDGCSDIITLLNMFQYLIAQNNVMEKQIEEARKNGLKELVEKVTAKK